MKENPVLFKPDMVRAILAGTKTVTRRLSTNPNVRRWKPGDTLWVRETHRHDFRVGRTIYAADVHARDRCLYTWRPSIFMYKTDCRLRLQIVSIREASLQKMTQNDAMQEGLNNLTKFRAGWDAINPKNKWENNPLVRVVEFKTI